VDHSKYVNNNVKEGGMYKEEAWQKKLVEILLGNYSRVFREPEQALK
jgi:hypothetical protein